MSDEEEMAGSSTKKSKEELEEIIQRPIAQKQKDDKRIDMMEKTCIELDVDGFTLVNKGAKLKKTVSQQ